MTDRKHALTGKNLVAFEVGGVAYAVDIQQVGEIIRPLTVLAIPGATEGVVGVADHRGAVIPVIDLRARFGVASKGRQRDERWLIVRVRGALVALAVDRVTEVFGATEPRSRDVSHLAATPYADAVRGAYGYRGGVVFVVDLERIVTPESLRQSVPAGGGRDASA